VSITINGRVLEFSPGETVLKVATKSGIDIPHLCALDGAPSPSASCRLCVVEVEGSPKLQTSCTLTAADGMSIQTHTSRVLRARRAIVELLVANHPQDCLVCHRSGSCELADLSREVGARPKQYTGMKKDQLLDISSPAIWRDPNKCVLCGRCVTMCHQIQGIGAIDFIDRGFRTQVGPGFYKGINVSGCTYCGQCVRVCPTGALMERSHVDDVVAALADPDTVVVAQIAPAVPATLAAARIKAPTVLVMLEHLAAALKRIGVASVFDTGFAADLTIMEEATELVDRLQNGGALPMFTSCSPAWVNYVELHRPDLIPHMSTCKSPQQMAGALIKEVYPEREGLGAKRLVLVSLMPCTAKKYEAQDLGDVDYVLTTRELSALWERFGIDFDSFTDRAPLDAPFSEATGAARLFGGTGGVMEAAVRTAATIHGGRPGPRGPAHRGPRPGGRQGLHPGRRRPHLEAGRGKRTGPFGCGAGGRAHGHALCRGDVLPRRLRRWRRPTLRRRTQRGAQALGSADRFGRSGPGARLAREPQRGDSLRGVPGTAPGRGLAPTAAPSLHRPQCVAGRRRRRGQVI
jgi:iron-only hydrogenase group A